jgi:Ca-activated chloride channel family protein
LQPAIHLREVVLMLNVDVRSHRPYLRASAGGQKLFLMVKLLPSPEAARARPKVSLAVVVDTSGSMREPAPGTMPELVPTDPVMVDGKTYNATYKGTSKLDVTMDAARRLAQSGLLRPEDTVSLIHFDDTSAVLSSEAVGTGGSRQLEAIDRLREHSGGTQMAPGLRNAESELRAHTDATRTVLLLTDGLAIDEDACREAAAALASLQARIVALGVGEEYNEDLLADLASVTHGKPYDFRDMTMLPEIFETELGSATRQVVSDVEATVKTVRDVHLVSVARVYPSLADVDASQVPLRLGSLEAGDHTVFILELDVPERPPVRARLAQIGVTFLVPAEGYRGEVTPVDVTVEYTTDEALASAVDAEVMGYVQQRNVDNLVRQATQQAQTNPDQAAKTLRVARSMTQRLGNRGMTVALGQAEEELRSRGTIAIGTRKTIKLGARTQTMKVGPNDDLPQNVPSQDEIRRLTGA